jgi:hypothetical protein
MSGSQSHVNTLKRHGKFDFVDKASLEVTHSISNAGFTKNTVLKKASFSVAVPVTEEPTFRKLNKLQFRRIQNKYHCHWAILIKNKFVNHIFPLTTNAKFYQIPIE